jgi:MFS family permease
MSIGFGSLAFVTNRWGAALVIVAVGSLNGFVNLALLTVIQISTPDQVRGRVFGLMGGLVSAANVVGYAVGGALLQVASPRAVVAAAGVAGIVVAALFLVPMVTRASRRRAVTGDVAEVSYVGEP